MFCYPGTRLSLKDFGDFLTLLGKCDTLETTLRYSTVNYDTVYYGMPKYTKLQLGGNYKRPKSKIAVWGIGVVLSGSK